MVANQSESFAMLLINTAQRDIFKIINMVSGKSVRMVAFGDLDCPKNQRVEKTEKKLWENFNHNFLSKMFFDIFQENYP